MEFEGFENYLIYEDGRIWSKCRGKGRFLKPNPDSHGYLCVVLWKDGKGKTTRLHRLLGNAYIPNLENKPEIDHIDNIRQNNNIENLRWVTRSENERNKPAFGAVPFRGVTKNGKGFRARIKIDGKGKHIGTYDTPGEASEAFINFKKDNNILI